MPDFHWYHLVVIASLGTDALAHVLWDGELRTGKYRGILVSLETALLFYCLYLGGFWRT